MFIHSVIQSSNGYIVQYPANLFPKFQQFHSFTQLKLSTSTSNLINIAPFDSIIPFLSEHIQPSDQLLFLGTKTDLWLQLINAGYGTKKTGFMVVIDSNHDRIKECEDIAKSNENLTKLMSIGKLKFHVVDFSNMSEIWYYTIIHSYNSVQLYL